MRRLVLLAVLLPLAACQNTPSESAVDEAPDASSADALAPDASPADAFTPEDGAADAMTAEQIEAQANMPITLVSDAMPAAGPTRVASGAFSGASGHDVSGTAVLYRLDDGSHLVRLEGLESDNGPDLEVWLVQRTTGNVGRGGLELADLKSTRGNQNYEVPAGTDVSAYVGVSIWCDRFNVNFGTAELVAE